MNRFTTITLMLALCITGCMSSEEGIKTQKKHSLIDKSKIESLSGPVIDVPETVIDLGIIPLEEQEVVGEIFFFNPGDKPLQV